MGTARLHWFWRGTIAVLVSIAVSVAFYLTVFFLMTARAISNGSLAFKALWVAAVLSVFVAAPVVGTIAYALLTRRFGPSVLDGETHCRKCNYILRGITEPRCPECGERI